MKNYKVTVNGITYEVSVEEAETGSLPTKVTSTQQIATTASTPEPATVAPIPNNNATASADDLKIVCPMAGTILAIKVNVGDVVTKHQAVAVIEAMKMENEIVAPEAGKITSITAVSGASLGTGDLILTIAV